MFFVWSAVAATATVVQGLEYGVDVSFPLHYPDVLEADKNPLGDRQSFYNDFLNGCVEHFGKQGQRCVQTEADRIEMSLRQPQSMQVGWMVKLSL